MGIRPASGGPTGGRCVALAAALLLALGAGGAQAAPAGVAASGRVVSARAVPPAPEPAARPVAGAATAAAHADRGAAAVDEAPPPAATAAVSQATRAHGAAARTATIAGFAFHPGSMTVTAGETIGWTNDDAAPHTATADDGSFDTGRLAEGASGSHTFTTAGTFAYHCAIHPSMHGTVTVVAAASGGGSGTAETPASAPAPTPGAASAQGTLPRTGWDPAGVAAAGAGLLLAGCALRRRTRPR